MTFLVVDNFKAPRSTIVHNSYKNLTDALAVSGQGSRGGEE